MRNAFRVTLAVAAFFCVQAHAKGPKPSPRVYDCQQARQLPADASESDRRIACTIPPKYQRDVALAEYIGRAIRRHDLSAWLTTDELVKIKALPETPGTPAGWLTRELEDGNIETRYYAEVDGSAVAFASATLRFDGTGVHDAARLRPPQPAGDRELRLLAAKRLAMAQSPLYCSDRPPNTVIFEFEEDGEPQILVFIMTPWQDGSAPMGGYAMYRIDAKGERVIGGYEQTKRCLSFVPDKKRKADWLAVSHLTSATPTMFHVFMSLQYKTPVVVFTTQNRLLWKVDGGEVSPLAPGDASYDQYKRWSDGIEVEHEAVPTTSPIG